MVDVKSLRLLSCVFLLDILCSFRKSEKSYIMHRCFSCRYYRRFMREMEEEDRKVDAEVEEIHRTGVHP